MTKLTKAAPAPRTERMDRVDPSEAAVGRWYWVKRSEYEAEREGEGSDLGCVVYVGSNYAEIQFPGEGNPSKRIHASNFVAECVFEPNPDAVIAREVTQRQTKVSGLMDRVRELTARLAITPGKALGDGSETSALALRRGDGDLKKYKKDLVLAKDKTLPELFESIRHENKALATWLSASLIPLKAEVDAMRPAIRAIERRIFNVELYAGLVESVEEVRPGAPAALTEKLRIVQRRCYMDEECLAQYETGGMDFKSISAFDKWLGRAENLNRLLPFPRCLVAFRVRRNDKEREWENIRDLLRVMDAQQIDKLTFLYIRNGEQLFRLNTSIEFDEKLFPDMKAVALTSKLWARHGASSMSDLISDDEHQAMIAEEEEAAREMAARPKKDRHWLSTNSDRYEPFDDTNVHYDDIVDLLKQKAEEHNRLVLVLQGLLDRSPVLHPHPPWQIWTDAGFQQAIELVYDDTRVLAPGDAPDFEAFRKRLNASLTAGSVTVGQDDFWQRAEAVKEAARMDRSRYSHTREWRPTHVTPTGNPGPGLVARAVRVTKKGACTFEWNRERSWSSRGQGGDKEIGASITVPAGALLNASAYKAGGFKQFFSDPRTRADYLKWAPLLLVCEEFVAGNLKVREPVAKKTPARSREGADAYKRRKALRAFVGKAVRNARALTMQSGKVYAKGLLWRGTHVERGYLNVVGIDASGREERDASGALRYFETRTPQHSLSIDDAIPPAPRELSDEDEAEEKP